MSKKLRYGPRFRSSAVSVRDLQLAPAPLLRGVGGMDRTRFQKRNFQKRKDLDRKTSRIFCLSLSSLL
jgi:hypothetical protein